MKTFAVITTINSPTDAVKRLDKLLPHGLIVIGDRKTPKDWVCGDTRFLSVEAQAFLPLAFNEYLRHDHYSRKNVGYLHAMLLGAEVVYDTDDDNIPNDRWIERTKICDAEVATNNGWCNVYKHFNESRIWPRGLPLDAIDVTVSECFETRNLSCPIQQGLADGAPDVDAIWRIAMCSPAVFFSAERSVALGDNVWCPFNSQSTWWFPEAFSLMFLPTLAPFRMTDIWRSFVAQRCLWASGLGSVAFHSPSEVFQDRNPHNLLKDLEDEIPGYLHNSRIAEVLTSLPLKADIEAIPDNMRACYAAIVALGILPEAELNVLDAWLDDVKRLTSNRVREWKA